MDNHRIQVFSPDGKFLRKWGKQGAAPGQFMRPTGIVVDAAGQVYVADSENYRIQQFTSDGVLITYWGKQGSADGEFNSLQDLAFDVAGNLYIVAIDYRVQIFAPVEKKAPTEPVSAQR